MAVQQVEVSLGRRAIGIKDSELVRLVQGLRDLDDPAADSVAEEIRLLKLAGVRIDLLLTAAERGALVSAIDRLTTKRREYWLSQLLALVRATEAASA
jgi:hypothetical protein